MSAESGSGEQGGFEQRYPAQDMESIWKRGSLPSLLEDEVAMQKLDELYAHAHKLRSERPHPEYIPSEPGSELVPFELEMFTRLMTTPSFIARIRVIIDQISLDPDPEDGVDVEEALLQLDQLYFDNHGAWPPMRYDLPEGLHWMGPNFVDEWPTGQPPVESQGDQ